VNSRSATVALIFAGVGHFFAHLVMPLYPTVVLVMEGRWDMSYGDLLSLSLGGFVLFGLGALPAGWPGDRWSTERMMVVFFVGTGAAAIATGLTGSPITLALGLSAIGLFGSIGTALLIRNAANRGRALGWNGISGSIGLAVAPFVAGALAQMISRRRVHRPGCAVQRDWGGAAVLRSRKCNRRPARSTTRTGGVAERHDTDVHRVVVHDAGRRHNLAGDPGCSAEGIRRRIDRPY
jgi:MFS family permease